MPRTTIATGEANDKWELRVTITFTHDEKEEENEI
jgi:hypothetical protein